MAPLLQELSHLEVEPLEIVGREGVDTVRSQESSLETLVTLGDVEVATLLTRQVPFKDSDCCCCCCCPVCCCC